MSKVKKPKEFFGQDTRIAPLGVIAAPGAIELSSKVDAHLARWASEAGCEQPNGTFIYESQCPRFQSGDAKGLIKSSIRGLDLYIIVDIGNYSCEYQMFGHTNHMSPDDHYQDLKRLIEAIAGKAYRINVIMPMLYGSIAANSRKASTALWLCRSFSAWACRTLSPSMLMTPVCKTPYRLWALTT